MSSTYPSRADSYPYKRTRQFHGEGKTGSKTDLYRRWAGMKSRCYTKTQETPYKDYGGRGIEVCAEWQTDYLAFKRWALANGYEPGLTLDREKNDLGYSPDNCRWITQEANQRNKRNNLIVDAFGESKCLADWADDPRCQVPYGSLQARITVYGWAPERAITSPARISGRWAQ